MISNNFAEAEAEMVSESELSAEPEPDFTVARHLWGKAWQTHFYLFGFIFTVLLLYNVNSMLGLYFKTQKSVRRRKIFLAINSLLFFFNFSTALHLFIDPYSSGEHINSKLLRDIFFIIHGLRMPCLTASFTLVFISLVETTKLKLYSYLLQDRRYILVIIAIHFFISFVIHIYLIFEPNQFRILIICNLYFILFGLITSALSLYASYRIIRHIRSTNANLRGMLAISTSSIAMLNKNEFVGKSRSSFMKFLDYNPSISTFADKSLEKLLLFITVISISGLVLISAVTYSLRFVLDDQRDGLQPWPWYIYQTTVRCAEIVMVFTMSNITRRTIFADCCGLTPA